MNNEDNGFLDYFHNDSIYVHNNFMEHMYKHAVASIVAERMKGQ